MNKATDVVNSLMCKGYSQPKLAKIAHTTQATISRISKGASTSYEIGKLLEVELNKNQCKKAA